MKKLFASAALLFASTAFAAGSHDLTGKWKMHTNVAGNEGDQECKFLQTDNKLTGTCKGTEHESPITGSVDGDKVSWKYDSEYNGSPLTLSFSGTLDASGKIAGGVDVDPFGVTGEFTAIPSAPAEK
jgi:hypothetical protein